MKRFLSLLKRESRHQLPMAAITSAIVVGIALLFLIFQLPSRSFMVQKIRLSLYSNGSVEPVEELRGTFVTVRAPGPVAVQMAGENEVVANIPEEFRKTLQESMRELKRKLVPETWTLDSLDLDVSISVDDQEYGRKANRIVIERQGEKGIFGLEIFKGDARVYFSLQAPNYYEQLLKHARVSPGVLTSITTATLSVGFFLILLVCIGFLLVSLYQLAGTLSAERRDGSLPFIKTLPISDVRVSASKCIVSLGFTLLWAVALLIAVNAIMLVIICLGAGVKLAVGIDLVRYVSGQVIMGASESGMLTPNMPVNYYFVYFVLIGMFFLAGGIFNRHSFLVSLLFTLGTCALLAALVALAPEFRLSLGSVLAARQPKIWLVAALWNAVCLTSASLIYSRQEVR